MEAGKIISLSIGDPKKGEADGKASPSGESQTLVEASLEELIALGPPATPSEMLARASAYLRNNPGTTATVNGLALACGLDDHRMRRRWERTKGEDFARIITRAKAVILSRLELSMIHAKNPAAQIMRAKSMGLSDKGPPEDQNPAQNDGELGDVYSHIQKS